MPLNISATQSDNPETPEHGAVIEELLAELTSMNPREQMGEFKSWLRGALSLVHLHALTVLEAEGPLPMSRLADALDVSVASATGIVDRMEQRGLVERRHDEEDRRVVVVHPTEAGAAVFLDLAAHRRAGLSRLLEYLTEEELRGFLVGMRAIHRARAIVGRENANGHGGEDHPHGGEDHPPTGSDQGR